MHSKEGHALMDCPFVPFHIKTCIARHVELQNVARALMDQPQEQMRAIKTQPCTVISIL
jgi:hypothetical protein